MHAKKEHINGGFLLSVSIKILNIALLSGISMICAKNPKGSFVLFIILVFYNASGLLIFINLDVFAWTSLAIALWCYYNAFSFNGDDAETP